MPARTRRRPLRIIAPIGVLAAVGAAVGATAGAQAAPPPHNGKVTLCHATPPATAANGWVQITVSTNAVTHEGHGDHADDIIPAFTYYVKREQFTYPGQNLDTVFGGSTGADILANGCARPAPPPSSSAATTTEAPPPTTTHTHKPTPVVTSTDTLVLPPPHTHTVTVSHPAPAPTRTVTRTHPAPTRTTTEADAPPATVSTGREALPVNVHRPAVRSASPLATDGIAAGDTGDHGSEGPASPGLLAAVIGGSVAALLGVAALAFWRRRTNGAGA